MIVALGFIALGVFVQLASKRISLPAINKYLFSLLLFLYGGYRIYRAWDNYKNEDES